MSKRADLARILETEYGICSVADLEIAIERLGSVDISVFVCENVRAKSDHTEIRIDQRN